MYISRAESSVARKAVTYSKFVGVSEAVMAAFIYANLPLHRQWMSWCDLSVYGVSSTNYEAKNASCEG